jgi:hypothetical protein
MTLPDLENSKKIYYLHAELKSREARPWPSATAYMNSLMNRVTDPTEEKQDQVQWAVRMFRFLVENTFDFSTELVLEKIHEIQAQSEQQVPGSFSPELAEHFCFHFALRKALQQ